VTFTSTVFGANLLDVVLEELRDLVGILVRHQAMLTFAIATDGDDRFRPSPVKPPSSVHLEVGRAQTRSSVE